MSSGLIEQANLLLSQISRFRRPTLVQPQLTRTVQQERAILRLDPRQSEPHRKPMVCCGIIQRSHPQDSQVVEGCWARRIDLKSEVIRALRLWVAIQR